MPRIMLTRRHPASAAASQADVTGARTETLAAMLGRSRIGTACTIWLDSVSRTGGLARICRVRPDGFVVDVLVGDRLMEVTREGGEVDGLLVLHAAVMLSRSAGFVRARSLMDAADAVLVANGWVRHETLTMEWSTVPLA